MISIHPNIGPPDSSEMTSREHSAAASWHVQGLVSEKGRERLPLTLRCLLALRLIHDVEVGAEQPIKERTC
jgi:hypothetical protein